MKKLILLAALLIITTSFSLTETFGQMNKNAGYGFGIGAVLPLTPYDTLLTMHMGYNFSFISTLTLSRNFLLSGTTELGIMNADINYEQNTEKIKLINIQASGGIKYLISDSNHTPFVGVEVGMGSMLATSQNDHNAYETGFDINIAPQAGYLFQVGRRMYMAGILRYQKSLLFSEYSTITFQLAFCYIPRR